jgi:tetratricopeptide (TPR) repeat protein
MLTGSGVLGGLTLHRQGKLTPAAWLSLWRNRTRHEKQAIAAGGALIFVALLLAGIITLSAFDTPRRETGSRLDFYRIALNTFARHPLSGTGPFSFGLVLSGEHSIPPDQPHAHAHNLILNIAAELGLPGLIALCLTLAFIIRQSWRVLQAETDLAVWTHRAACAAALAGFGVQALVDMPMMSPAVMLLMIEILAAGIILPRSHDTRPKRLTAGLYRGGPLVLWGILLTAGFWSARVYTDFVRGEQWIAQGQAARGANILRDVAKNQPDFTLYQAEYAYACGLAAYQGHADYVQPGITAYRRALTQEHDHADWWANLAALYWQAGQPDQALDAMQQATNTAPDSPDLWLNLGLYYEAVGQVGQAESAYERVLEINSMWGHASFWTETPLRQKVITQHPPEPTPYMQAQQLWQAGHQAAAVDILEGTIHHDPSQPGPYFRLARLVAQAGDLNRAENYLAAARVLVHTDHDWAWIALIEGEIAQARGDQRTGSIKFRAARHLLWPDDTGYPLVYGKDIANLQFLRVRINGSLLPQLTVLSPDPILADLLR